MAAHRVVGRGMIFCLFYLLDRCALKAVEVAAWVYAEYRGPLPVAREG